MSITEIKNIILVVLSGIGAFFANILGGWDAMLKVLVAMMAADYATGIIVAAIFKKSPKSESGTLNSHVGFKGLVKKCMIFVLVYLAVLLDNAIGERYIRAAVIIFFIGNEGLSLLENVGLMGVPYPTSLKNMLEALRNQGDEGSQE